MFVLQSFSKMFATKLVHMMEKIINCYDFRKKRWVKAYRMINF